jgi:hypothetical protein
VRRVASAMIMRLYVDIEMWGVEINPKASWRWGTFSGVAQARGYVVQLTCDNIRGIYLTSGHIKGGDKAEGRDSVLAGEAYNSCGSSVWFRLSIGGR